MNLLALAICGDVFFLNAFRWNNPQEITGKFPGYLSPSAGLKFADVPNGLAAISKVPAAGQGWNNWIHLKIKAINIYICVCVDIYIYIHIIYHFIFIYNIYTHIYLAELKRPHCDVIRMMICRATIPRWPFFRLVNYCSSARYISWYLYIYIRYISNNLQKYTHFFIYMYIYIYIYHPWNVVDLFVDTQQMYLWWYTIHYLQTYTITMTV